MRSSKQYWEERGAILELLSDARAKLTAAQIAGVYDRALQRIAAQIRKIFNRYADRHTLTQTEAISLLTVRQTAQLRQELLDKLAACTDDRIRAELTATLEAPAYAYRMSREEALRNAVWFEVRDIVPTEETLIAQRLEDTYKQGYYRTMFDLQQFNGAGFDVPELPDYRVKTALSAYWNEAPEALGKHFSQRVWDNNTKLAESVREIIPNELMTGGNYQRMMERIQAEMGSCDSESLSGADVRKVESEEETTPELEAEKEREEAKNEPKPPKQPEQEQPAPEKKPQQPPSERKGEHWTRKRGNGAKYRAERLVRTECNRITGQTRLDAYKKAGIDRYEYSALLEVHTCPVCGALDGKVFAVKDAQVGVNMHPMHPNCRCSIGPYFDEHQKDGKQRAARDAEGKGFLVPQSMTYAQWYQKYIAKSGERGTMKQTEMFHSSADPMYEATGSAYDSNPEEISHIKDVLKSWGVDIEYGSNTLGYGCIHPGKPGAMSITRDASYSAWLHEFQHVKDDKAAGWNGLEVLWTDPNERERRERTAYQIEIDMARSMGREDIAKRLEVNLQDEIKRIWNV